MEEVVAEELGDGNAVFKMAAEILGGSRYITAG
jgi:hypothetical protein